MTIRKFLSNSQDYLWPLMFVVILIFLTYNRLLSYLQIDFHLILFLLAAPFVIRKEESSISVRYGIGAVILLIFQYFSGLSTLYFFAVVMALLFIYESNFGKLQSIPLILLIVSSPVAILLTDILGFEIRLKLTEAAVYILKFLNDGYQATGNIIMLNGMEFRVDPECTGLKMITVSFFTALLIISYFRNSRQKRIRFLNIILLLVITLALSLAANLFRIILITVFQSFPGTIGHEMIGIICLIVYVIIPQWFIIWRFPGSVIDNVGPWAEQKEKPVLFYILLGIIFSLFIINNYFGRENSYVKSNKQNSKQIEGYRLSIPDENVCKYENDDFIMYRKTGMKFYTAEHSPIVCWKGCGYEIQNEKVISIAGREVYFNLLNKGSDRLYSVWWYESEDTISISQFGWRFDSLISGNEYMLVNIIGYDENMLLEEAKRYLADNL